MSCPPRGHSGRTHPRKEIPMQRLAKNLVPLTFGLAMGLIAACHEEGPAERAGRQIDEAAQQAGEAMKEAGEKARDEMGKMGRDLEEKTEDAGEKTQGK
jgi:hypothetical protein